MIVDTFERSLIGSNWTNTSYIGGACFIYLSSKASAQDATEMCYWNPDTPPTAAYACGQLAGADTSGYAAVCLAIDNTGGGNGVCCIAQAGAPSPWSLGHVFNGGIANDDTAATPTFTVGDYIGIQRTSATAFRCYRSTNGTSWTALGFGATETAPNPGRWGMLLSNDTGGFVMEKVEFGAGTLPTDHTCGGP